ncbi:hypothetical protein EJ04DRAFT_543022 [Polyplosphaeria fusca]|uniref:PH domain-containing protein n=1 Tax=Polyplosphaeria fusca TaxID=682080 RepID=A0A9P4V0N4_9PLEO|nr:hypothetical protein EJ04DRAFT_543022 [Polyplosphaeria fusca]
MATEEPKPAVTSEVPIVEPTPAVADAPAADKPAEVVEPKVEEPKEAVKETEAAAPAEEKVEEEAKPVESGALGYKAPGLKNQFRFSKKYFWFSEDPVAVQSLSQYLRGEKAEVAHPTAAWSSQTGKGLLYFVKHENKKETPDGVLNLAEATELTKDGLVAFHFKLHGHKHAFEAQTAPERNGWFVAVEKAIETGKATKETIVGTEGYKEQLDKLGKPAIVAATAKESTPKKSTEAPKPVEAEASASAEPAAARTGSSSSSSSDEDKKKKKAAKSKSRSVSRGKRSSLFGGFLGKKEKAEEKKEEPEAKKEEEAAVPATEAPVAAPLAEETPKPAEEPKAEAVVVPAAGEPVVAEEKKEEEKPKPVKRGSIFGTFVEKLKSPTHEKKEADVGPAPPAKEPEVAAEAPKIEEPETTPAPVVVDTPAEAAKEESKEEAKPATTTPHKEKSSFSLGKFLGGAKEKVKSPTAEKAPAAETPKVEEPAKEEAKEETPAVAPAEPAVEAPKEETPAVASPAAATPAPKKEKRGSIFSKEGVSGLFRSASKATKPKKEKEATTTPEKVEETAEPKEADEATKEIKPAETTTPAAPAEPKIIGDVVPDAVTVGQAPKSTPEVSATA